MQDHYTGSNEILLTEIKEDRNNWRAILFLWVRRLNIHKMLILIKIPVVFF